MIRIRPVTPTTFADLATPFEARGGPDWRWCMVWRAKPGAVAQAKGIEGKALRKAAMQVRVAAGEHVGLLAYAGGVPVAWVSTGPVATFARLGGPNDIDPQRTWAISCFFVARAHRGAGLTRSLAEAALDAAREVGATLFQVTPVTPDSPSFGFMGYVPFYKSLGFEEVGMAGTRRHVMQRRLQPVLAKI